MASIVLSSVGSALGNFMLPGVGGSVLGYLGGRAGQWVDKSLGIIGSASSEGARLENISVQDSSYGGGIPIVYGRARIAGNVIWASDLIETAHQDSTSGGKGGLTGSSGRSRTTFTYSLHCAIAICAGQIKDIATIWADSKIIYQNGVWKSGVVSSATIYAGDMTQTVDPLLESWIGSGQVPAYRGVAYIVLESLQLANFGNRLPSLTFEVLSQTGTSLPVWTGSVDAGIAQDPVGLRNALMSPLVVEGSTSSARKVLVGGYHLDGSNLQFSAGLYDVTDSCPRLISSQVSEAFAVSNNGAQAWALSPDGRFVAVALFDGMNSSNFRVSTIIYDTESQRFGSVLSVARANDIGTGPVAWLDAQHFAVTDKQAGLLGVRVFARAGLSLVDQGFFDVWGSASSQMKLFGQAQFTPLSGGGVVTYASVTVSSKATVSGKALVWKNNTLVVGQTMVLISAMPILLGSGGQCFFVQTRENEWTLFYAGSANIRLFSFEVTEMSLAITRPFQILSSAGLSSMSCCYPVLFGSRLVVVIKNLNEGHYLISEIALSDDGFSLVADALSVQGQTDLADYFAAVRLDGSRLLFAASIGSGNDLAQCAIIQRRNTADTLDHIVGDIMTRCGYVAADFALDALQDVALSGYVLSDPMTGAAALGPLQIYAPFDLVESDDQIRAVKHGNVAAVSLLASEVAAQGEGSEKVASDRAVHRQQELDLPLEISVNYLDPARDYEIGTQRARRTATHGAKALVKVDLPIVCTASEAKQIAESRLYSLWAERDVAKLTVSRRWLGLDIGDVVDLGDRQLRVAKVDLQEGLLALQGPLVPRRALVSQAAGDTGGTGAASLSQTVDTSLMLMDLPLLQASDDQAGLYVAASGSAGWTGAALMRAADDVNYTQVGTMGAAAVMGYACSVLDVGPCCYRDRAGSVQVQLLSGSLSSCGEDALLNGANAALCGDEIIQFQTATLIDAGLYRLENLLRGRLGTEAAIATHAVGDRFVLLQTGCLQFLPALLSDRNKVYSFKAPSFGQTLGQASAVSFTYGLKTLQPLAPVHVGGVRVNGNGSDLSLSWKRRARKEAAWVDYIDVPLDADVELYDLEILKDGAVVRTFAGLSAPGAVYTASMQGADWEDSFPAAYDVRVYQVSAKYGRGQAACASI